MAISIEQIRELLVRRPSEDVAKALKEWRAQEGFSQSEAAIRLGVLLRTLQGWELGRPMPYPGLLQRAAHIPARTADRHSLVQSDFPHEFAEFIDFVGASDFDQAIRRVDQKLCNLSVPGRSLYGDRYFFHLQCIRFVEGAQPFRLDVSDVTAVRAATLIAGVNRVKRALSSKGTIKLHGMVIDNLKPDRDIRQLEHEIRCSTHFGRMRFKVTYVDLEGLSHFEFLVDTQSAQVEVECKTVTEETGSQIKTDLNVRMSEFFRAAVEKRSPVDESGLFILAFNKPADQFKSPDLQLKTALKSETPKSFLATDFSLTFSGRPQWQALLDSEQLLDLQRHILLDPDIAGYARCAIKLKDKVVGLVLRPHKPSVLAQRVTTTIKDAADQCSGERPSAIWLHFVGLAEAEFLPLAQFAMAGKGAGLNAIVANAVHPDASTTDRSHVRLVRFSAVANNLSSHAAVDPNLLIRPAVSLGGACYDVPNPKSRFPEFGEF